MLSVAIGSGTLPLLFQRYQGFLSAFPGGLMRYAQIFISGTDSSSRFWRERVFLVPARKEHYSGNKSIGCHIAVCLSEAGSGRGQNDLAIRI